MSFIQTVHAAEGISVKLTPYIVGEVFGVPISATVITAWFTIIILVALVVIGTRRLALVPGRFQNFLELTVGGVYDYMADVLESKRMARKYFPVVMTIFVFVLGLNWVGLLPGVTAFGTVDESNNLIPWLYPAATDLNITIAFALVAIFAIQVAGMKTLGTLKYLGKFFNFHSPLGFIIGIIELISEFARIISFSFRLCGNIFAGKVLLVVVIFFVPYIMPVPVLAFEVFVGFVQAFVFAILTLFFIKLAASEPH